MSVRLNHLLALGLYLATFLFTGCATERVGVANRLLRAPIVGLSRGDQTNIAVVGITAGKARIAYRATGTEDSLFSAWEPLLEGNGYAASIALTALEPEMAYDYRVEFDAGEPSPSYGFTTFPPQNEPGKFSFVFSACFRERYRAHVIFDHIREENPTFLALLGDNMYGDYDGDIAEVEAIRDNPGYEQTLLQQGDYLPPGKTVLEVFRNKYQRNFDSYFQAASSSIPVMAIWDDHDYGQDNSDMNYPYKVEASKVFKETFPRYPLVESSGALYYRYTVADVEFFVLDTRWYRVPMETENGPEKSILGLEQLQWLLEGLKNSTAAYKFIISSVSWNDYGGDTSSGRPGLDSWHGYVHERAKILAYIRRENLNGILIFSGDQHYPSAHIMNWDAQPEAIFASDTSVTYSLSDLGSAVIDFSASPLSYHRASGEILPPENQANPDYSYEIYRAPWGLRGDHSKWNRKNISSVYGHVEVDTDGPSRHITVTFKHLDWATAKMVTLYTVELVD
ncbi:MAG: alkaline phosphatase D family protein [Candidatus Marinimicrobia bacterium]|nr:alkaline phosphatase D family protein [Candidatus Neomarinimicrobiota bacterium]